MKTFALTLTLALTASMGSAEIETRTQSQLDWETTPEGVAFAALDGARFEEAYHAMVRLPAGLTSPAHIKSANMFGLMIAGEMAHFAADADAEDAPVVGPGDYYKIPANMPHISACVSAQPCITYLFQDGAFDFIPVTQ